MLTILGVSGQTCLSTCLCLDSTNFIMTHLFIFFLFAGRDFCETIGYMFTSLMGFRLHIELFFRVDTDGESYLSDRYAGQ